MMKTAKIFLEILKKYDVKHVFGLPGETTLPLYIEWVNYPDIKHIMVRDERSAAYMADGYARVSFKPGIVEAPSSGATHIIPAIVEAYKSSIPIIAITTDIPLHLEKKNMLTGYDQSGIFQGITKESYTITKGNEIPYILRRAFRIAVTGKPGPVHIRIPVDVLEEEVNNPDIYGDREFTKYPGHRFIANPENIRKAVNILEKAEKPLIICGQGTLLSQAWSDVIDFANTMKIPIGTTITGKGCINTDHPLSIGVVGNRGGTSFSNTIVKNSDTIFYIGCNTDSAATDVWKLPSLHNDKKIIHLDISELEAGNVYETDTILIGDAKATIHEMIKIVKRRAEKNKNKRKWIETITDMKEKYNIQLKRYIEKLNSFHPLKILKTLEDYIPKKHIIVADPGISAIYTSAFWPVKKPGRNIIFNYSIGALGYSLPASIGAYMARSDYTIVNLMGDGSFGFIAGELETVRRVNADIKILLYNNRSFGWIRAELRLVHKTKHLPTDFYEVDYCKIADGYKLPSYSIDNLKDLETTFKKVFKEKGPVFIELKVKPEDIEIPPVPKWIKSYPENDIKSFY